MMGGGGEAELVLDLGCERLREGFVCALEDDDDEVVLVVVLGAGFFATFDRDADFRASSSATRREVGRFCFGFRVVCGGLDRVVGC